MALRINQGKNVSPFWYLAHDIQLPRAVPPFQPINRCRIAIPDSYLLVIWVLSKSESPIRSIHHGNNIGHGPIDLSEHASLHPAYLPSIDLPPHSHAQERPVFDPWPAIHSLGGFPHKPSVWAFELVSQLFRTIGQRDPASHCRFLNCGMDPIGHIFIDDGCHASWFSPEHAQRQDQDTITYKFPVSSIIHIFSILLLCILGLKPNPLPTIRVIYYPHLALFCVNLLKVQDNILLFADYNIPEPHLRTELSILKISRNTFF